MAEHLSRRETLPKTREEMEEAMEEAPPKLRMAYHWGQVRWSMLKYILREQRRPSAAASAESITSDVTSAGEGPSSGGTESPAKADQ